MAQPAPAPMDSQKQITINADGTYDPAGGVTINPGGEVKFNVTYPTGTDTCTITFSTSEEPTDTGGNTIKVGS